MVEMQFVVAKGKGGGGPELKMYEKSVNIEIGNILKLPRKVVDSNL